MSTLLENIAKVEAANGAIKAALEGKHADVSDYSRLSQAAEKISAIPHLYANAAGGLFADVEYVETEKEG